MTDNPKAKLEVAATIEDILKPLMAAARFTGITEHPRWDIYAT